MNQTLEPKTPERSVSFSQILSSGDEADPPMRLFHAVSFPS